MAVPLWALPYTFRLKSPYSSAGMTPTDPVVLNEYGVDIGGGLTGGFLLDQTQCKFTGAVRSTSQNVPEGDGSILHRRFLTGVQIKLAIQLWEEVDQPACDEHLQRMLDILNGSFISLLNSEDNQGRLQWAVASGDDRILDDARLLVYPEHVATSTVDTVIATIDTAFPYALDLTQVSSPLGATVVNAGTIEMFPVFQIDAGATAFTLTNVTTGEQIVYNGAAIPGVYGEINTFKNTFFGDVPSGGTDLMNGIDILNSQFFTLQPGTNQITLSGATGVMLWQSAWG